MGKSLLTIVLLSFTLAVPAQQVYVDEQNGFQLTIPDEWRRVPEQPFREYCARVASKGIAVSYVAAFEPIANGDHHFNYPYCLIQIHSYPRNTRLTSISRDELEALCENVSGKKMLKTLEDKSPQIRTQIGNLDGTAMLVEEPPGFLLSFEMDVASLGKIRGRSTAVAGATNCMFLHFYAPASDWNKHSKVEVALSRSLMRTSDQKISIGNTTNGVGVSRPFDWSKVLVKAIIGGAIGLVGAGVAAIKAKNKKLPTPPPLPPCKAK